MVSQGVAAMQSINKVILGSLFMPVFFGTAACCVVLVIASFFHWGVVNEIAIPSGSALYLIGTFLVTMVCNVPLNNELASVESTGAAAAKTWARYVRSWTLWNHLRTGAALAASIALGLAAS